jgi:uncharacterized delta-60 repeat protein
MRQYFGKLAPVKLGSIKPVYDRVKKLKLKLFRKYFLTQFVFLLCFFNSQSPAWAADGDLDTSFDTDGKVTTPIGSGNDYVNSVVVQSDGKIVAAGDSINGITNEADFAIVRYNTDGSLDTTFGTGGKVTTQIGSRDATATDVVLQSDGKIVAAGYSYNGSNYDFAIVRYNTDGSLDTTFDTDGKVTTPIALGDDKADSVVLQSDGKIVAAGYARIGSDNDFAIIRYNTNGSLDTTFDTDGIQTTALGVATNDYVYSVVLQSDGKIVAAGYTFKVTEADFAIVRYNTNGSLDTTFDTDGKLTTPIGSGSEVAYSVVLQSDGKIVAAGYSYNGTDTDFAVLRYNTDGSLDSTFGTGGKLTTPIGSGDDNANSVVLQSDGKIVVAGSSGNGSNSDFAVLRYNSGGSLDTTFGTGGKVTTPIGSGNDYASDVVLQSDGKIIVAGSSRNGSNYDFAVVRYTISVSSLSWVGSQSITCPAPNPWVKEKLGFASNVKPVLVTAENTVGKTISQGSYDSLKSSGVLFDTVSKKVSTATETLPIYGCKDKLLSGKVNQPIQFIAGGYTLQSDAHGYINTADLKWHDTNGVTLYTNTAAFMHTIKFTKTGKYVVVLTEQPDTSRGLIPTYGVRSIRFVININ